jgi:hypothetical protein
MMASSSAVKGGSPGGAGYLLVKVELHGGVDMVDWLYAWIGYEVGVGPDAWRQCDGTWVQGIHMMGWVRSVLRLTSNACVIWRRLLLGSGGLEVEGGRGGIHGGCQGNSR